MDAFINQYEQILHYFAEFMAFTLELIGILIIVIGSVRALVRLARHIRSRGHFNVVIDLGLGAGIQDGRRDHQYGYCT